MSTAPTAKGAFSQYKALVFDCYGTLIDWESGIYASLRPLFPPSATRADVLSAFATTEAELQARHPSLPYAALLARVHASLANADPSTPTPDAEAFGASPGTWLPFPDTAPALRALSRHFKLLILSNVDRANIARTRALLEAGGDGFAFDAVITAEDVGAYKPAPAMLDAALARVKSEWGIEQHEVLMTAQSVFHDILPASKRGIDGAWINREGSLVGLDDGFEDMGAKFVFKSLGEMAAEVDKST